MEGKYDSLYTVVELVKAGTYNWQNVKFWIDNDSMGAYLMDYSDEEDPQKECLYYGGCPEDELAGLLCALGMDADRV